MTKKDMEGEASFAPTLLACPNCQKQATLIQVQENVPLFGSMLLQTLVCKHCGFKWSDVMSLDIREPAGFEAEIKEEKDLHVKIVRNSSGTVEIPELGVLLEPGPFAEGFFTNMEGLLERVAEVLSMLANSHDHAQAHAAKERMTLLRKCQEGKHPFTVRVLDPLGGSALIGKGVTRFHLSESQLKSLKKGVHFTSST